MANANVHFDRPKVLSSLQDTSSVAPHRDSGNARALEKSGEIGKRIVSMYIQLRMTMFWQSCCNLQSIFSPGWVVCGLLASQLAVSWPLGPCGR